VDRLGQSPRNGVTGSQFPPVPNRFPDRCLTRPVHRFPTVREEPVLVVRILLSLFHRPVPVSGGRVAV
jgi:hypothetical protein